MNGVTNGAKNGATNMRIAYVLKVFPRLSETFILNEILELEAQGAKVDIFSLHPPNDSRFHGKLSRLHGEITYLPRADSSEMWKAIRSEPASQNWNISDVGAAFARNLRLSYPASLQYFLQALWIAGQLQKRNIHHIHAHFASSATHVATLINMISGLSFSFTAHAKDIYHKDRERGLLEDALDRAAFAVTVTDFNAGQLKELKPEAADKIKRIYNGLPLEELSPSLEPEHETPILVSVGRLVEKKGFPYLIEACRILKDRGTRFRCVLIGGGEMRRTLAAHIDRLELTDCVELRGPQCQETTLDVIRQSSLMVLPCIVGDDGNRDALPTVLLEAMALGRPVVSTDLEGVTEIVSHGETGLLVPQRDASQLAEALDLLLGDGALRARMGCAARRTAQTRFDVRKNVGELMALYEEAIHGSGVKSCA